MAESKGNVEWKEIKAFYTKIGQRFNVSWIYRRRYELPHDIPCKG